MPIWDSKNRPLIFEDDFDSEHLEKFHSPTKHSGYHYSIALDEWAKKKLPAAHYRAFAGMISDFGAKMSIRDFAKLEGIGKSTAHKNLTLVIGKMTAHKNEIKQALKQAIEETEE